MVMTILVIVRIRQKSRGGGEGGKPTKEQGEGASSGPRVGPGGGHRAHMRPLRQKGGFIAGGAR